MSPKKIDRTAKRTAILDAAIRVFARRGFAATRVDDVALEAGVAKGSVYLYFSSRDELLVAAFDTVAERSTTILNAARRPGDPLARLSTLVHSVIGMMAAEPALARVLLDLWSTRDESASPIDMASIYQTYREVISELLQEGAASGIVRADVTEHHALVVVAAVEGCVVQWLADPSIPIADLAGPVADVLFDGLQRRADAPHGADT